MSTTSCASLGSFTGIGVGPGPRGLIPVLAVECLKTADVILCPQARNKTESVARTCLEGIDIDESRIVYVEFDMEADRKSAKQTYVELAATIAEQLKSGKNVAYLTIGDSLTFSTYSYTLQAIQRLLPELHPRTIPGITSYSAAASAFNWPLGQGKERILILPCPETADELRSEIESHDVVVLMKIGRRLKMVIDALNDLGIAPYCAFAGRIGLDGEILRADLSKLNIEDSAGYLSTMLIRKSERKEE